jgi:hypothetical protein
MNPHPNRAILDARVAHEIGVTISREHILRGNAAGIVRPHRRDNLNTSVRCED